MSPTRTIRESARERSRGRRMAPGSVRIQLADGPVTLSLAQLQLLLFLADRLPNPPKRVLSSSYHALEDERLIEEYSRSYCGKESPALRITERGKTASELAEVTLIPPSPRR